MDELPAQNILQFRKPNIEFKFQRDPHRYKCIDQQN